MSNFYEILGVRAGSHPAEIDLAYKTILQVPNLDAAAKLELSMAYNTLLHPLRRLEYDQTLQAQIKSTQDNHPKPLVTQQYEYTPSQTNNPLTGFAAWYMMAMAVTTVIGTAVMLL